METTIVTTACLMCSAENMGGCHDYGPFLGTLNIRCRIIMGI